MSLGAKIAVSAMRGIKKTGLIKGLSADLDAELRKAKKYNRKHPYARLCESQNRGVKAVRILIFGAGVIGIYLCAGTSPGKPDAGWPAV